MPTRSRFVAEAKRIVIEMDGEISNVDITIIAQKPKLAPHRDAMQAKIAHLLDLPAATSTSKRRRPITSGSSAARKESARWRSSRSRCRVERARPFRALSDRTSSTSAARGLRSSTGCSRGITAARSSSASRTPTRRVRRASRRRWCSRICAGCDCSGKRVLTTAARTRRTGRSERIDVVQRRGARAARARRRLSLLLHRGRARSETEEGGGRGAAAALRPEVLSPVGAGSVGEAGDVDAVRVAFPCSRRRRRHDRRHHPRRSDVEEGVARRLHPRPLRRSADVQLLASSSTITTWRSPTSFAPRSI